MIKPEHFLPLLRKADLSGDGASRDGASALEKGARPALCAPKSNNVVRVNFREKNGKGRA